MNEILNINNVHGYLDKETGTAYLNAEDVARGFGFVESKSGVEYVKWRRVNAYLHEFGFSPDVAKDDFLPENMVYRLGFKASNEVAQKFQAVLADEVLPAIRKTGGYIANAETMTDAEIMSKALLIAKQTIESREQRIHSLEAETERMKPKEIFADAVSASNSSILIGDLAKILHGNGIKIGRGRLFAWMREHGYLIKQKGTSYNMPTQRAMELKLFKVKEGSYVDGKGNNVITKTTKVTGKGQQYFINKFLAEKS